MRDRYEYSWPIRILGALVFALLLAPLLAIGLLLAACISLVWHVGCCAMDITERAAKWPRRAVEWMSRSRS